MFGGGGGRHEGKTNKATNTLLVQCACSSFVGRILRTPKNRSTPGGHLSGVRACGLTRTRRSLPGNVERRQNQGRLAAPATAGSRHQWPPSAGRSSELLSGTGGITDGVMGLVPPGKIPQEQKPPGLAELRGGWKW